MVLGIVGNKCDLPEKSRKVDTRMGEQLAATLCVDFFMETSAKNCINVHELFEIVAKKAIRKKQLVRKRLENDHLTADGRDSGLSRSTEPSPIGGFSDSFLNVSISNHHLDKPSFSLEDVPTPKATPTTKSKPSSYQNNAGCCW